MDAFDSTISDDSAVARKRMEFEAALHEQNQKLTRVIETKDRRIGELSAFIERLVADFKYNYALVEELQQANEAAARDVADAEASHAATKQQLEQTAAQRGVLQAEVLQCRAELDAARRQYDADQAKQQEYIAKLERLQAAQRERVSQDVARELKAREAVWEEQTQRMKLDADRALTSVKYEAEQALERASNDTAAAKRRLEEAEQRACAATAEASQLRDQLQQYEDRCHGLESRIHTMQRTIVDTKASQSAQLLQTETELSITQQAHEAQMQQEAQKRMELETSVMAAKSTEKSLRHQVESLTALNSTRQKSSDELIVQWEHRFTTSTRELSDRIRTLEGELDRANASLTEARRAVDEGAVHSRELADDRAKVRTEAAGLRSKVDAQANEIEALRAQVSQLEEANAMQKRTLETALRDSRADADKQRDALTNATQKMHELERNRLSELQTAHNDLAAQKQRASQLDGRLRATLEELEGLKLQNYPEVIADLRIEIEKRDRRIRVADDEVRALRDNINTITSELQSDRFVMAAKERDARVVQLEHELRDAKAQCVTLEHELHAARRTITEVEARTRSASQPPARDPNERARLEEEVQQWMNRAAANDAQLQVATRKQASLAAQLQEAHHRMQLLERERDDVIALNTKLRAQQLHVQRAADASAAAADAAAIAEEQRPRRRSASPPQPAAAATARSTQRREVVFRRR